MVYSNSEKIAIVGLLYEMMMADGHSEFNEQIFISQVAQKFGLSSIQRSTTIAEYLRIIKLMGDDKKMEFAAMLQQMMMADGIQDRREMRFFSTVVAETGIDKVFDKKNEKMGVKYDNAKIYCNSSKNALQERTPEYLAMIDNMAQSFKNGLANLNLSKDEICKIIIDHTKQSVIDMDWAIDDVDGVSWFIGNFSDAMVKAGLGYNYDDLFVTSFNLYFNN